MNNLLEEIIQIDTSFVEKFLIHLNMTFFILCLYSFTDENYSIHFLTMNSVKFK